MQSPQKQQISTADRSKWFGADYLLLDYRKAGSGH